MPFNDTVKAAIAQLTLTTEQPGVLLHEFVVFLQAVADKPVPLSKAKQLPPPKWAATINARLMEPAVVTLQRPQTLHYPTVLGCYLLARASGLAQVETPAKGAARLVVNSEMLTQWQSLNHAERYFSLLDAWINRGHGALVGTCRGGWDDRLFFQLLSNESNDYWQGVSVPPDRLDGIFHFSGNYTLQLAKLFGVASLTLSENSQGLGSFHLTPWGSVFLQGYRQHFLEQLKEGNLEEDIELHILSVIKQLRNDVKNTLTLPEHTIADTYILNVSVDDNCSRTLAVPANTVMDELADAILDAFAFDDKWHLYYFEYKTPFGRQYRCNHPELFDGDSLTSETKLKDLTPTSGMRFTFVFDIGAHWEFTIHVMDEYPERRVKPERIDHKGQAPEQYEEGKDDLLIIMDNTVFKQ